MWRTFGGMMEFLIESQDAADEDDEFEIDHALDEMGEFKFPDADARTLAKLLDLDV